MGTDKLESMQEKAKEKFEEKAKRKKEEEIQSVTPETKKEEKPKKKVEIKKPVVTEATGRGEHLGISPKISVEVARAIRGKPVAKAKQILNYAITLERPIRYYRFQQGTPHRKGDGFGPGRYPQKVAKAILGVLDNAVANAQYLNLDPENLYIKAIITNRGIPKRRGGRYTHVNITVAEIEKQKKETKKPKAKPKTGVSK
jgi:large subunit ribosomal protein L22